MHFLENIGHTKLCSLFFSHLGQFTFGDGSLFVTFLELFVRQEVLRHNARDLPEVVKDGKAWILLLFGGRWAKFTEFVLVV